MGKWVPRAALMAIVVLLLASSLAGIGQATASPTPTYTLLGYVEGPGGASALPVPAGVTVVLTSSANGQTVLHPDLRRERAVQLQLREQRPRPLAGLVGATPAHSSAAGRSSIAREAGCSSSCKCRPRRHAET